jgi:hypothetical protein
MATITFTKGTNQITISDGVNSYVEDNPDSYLINTSQAPNIGIYGERGKTINLSLTDDTVVINGVEFSGTAAELKTALLDGVFTSGSSSSGSGGGTIESVTYADLVTAITGSTLTVGQQYLITDFATTHYIVDANGTQYLDTIITGATEGLIVTAVAVNKISAEAKSILYPQDVIHYDWNPDNWLDDLSFADLTGTPAIVTGFKGVIYFRHDTLLDNYMGYDFRNCKFRRWKTDAPVWDSGTTYTKGQWVNDGSFLCRSLQNANTNNATTDAAWWTQVLNLSTTEYWHNGNDVNGLTKDSLSFVDVKTFAETGTDTYETAVLSNHFESFKDHNSYDDLSGTILGNNVFWLGSEGLYTVYSNRVEAESYGNSIGANFSYNSIGAGFNYNSIGAGFNSNSIGANFNSNSIGAGFNSNSIGANFYSNNTGANFNSNSIGAFFNYNSIGAGFNSNSIGAFFNSNSIGAFFNYNSIGANFNSNSIGAGFNSNNIGAGLSSIDFTSASHVYNAYTCTLFKREDGTAKLSYYNNSDVQVIVNANA